MQHAKIDVSSALDLKLNHQLSYADIGKIQGVSPQAIHQAIRKLIPEETLDYQKNRSKVFAGLQWKLIKSINDDVIKKSPLGSRILALCQLYDKEMLERGKSGQGKAPVLVIVKGNNATVNVGSPPESEDIPDVIDV